MYVLEARQGYTCSFEKENSRNEFVERKDPGCSEQKNKLGPNVDRGESVN
jgi:hypothetical protein